MKFIFKVADLEPLVNHARGSSEWAMGYGNEDTPEPGLLLVKDSGAYLMSNGQPRQKAEKGKGCLVVYAKGCKPEDGHIGGDDFVEVLTLNFLAEFLLFANKIIITLTDNQLSIRGV